MVAMITVALYNYFRMQKGKKGTGYIFFVVFILLFSLYYRPAGGDFWGYLSYYQMGYDIASYDVHMEPYYYWLMQLIPNNFLLWRTAVWLPAAILIALVYKKMNVNSSNATTFFFVFALTQVFYYLRNILGFSVLSFAIVFVCSKGNTWKRFGNIVIFAGLLYISWFLHRSMPIYIGLALLAIFLPFNKKYLAGAVVAIPILYSFIMIFASEIISLESLWSSGNGIDYLEADNTYTMNWKGFIDSLIRYAPIIYFYYIAFIKPIPQDSADFPYFKVFLLYSFFIFCVSLLFLGQAAATLQLRFYYTSMLPFAFVVSLYFKNYLKTKQFNVFLGLMMIYFCWELFKNLVSNIG